MGVGTRGVPPVKSDGLRRVEHRADLKEERWKRLRAPAADPNGRPQVLLVLGPYTTANRAMYHWSSSRAIGSRRAVFMLSTA